MSQPPWTRGHPCWHLWFPEVPLAACSAYPFTMSTQDTEPDQCASGKFWCGGHEWVAGLGPGGEKAGGCGSVWERSLPCCHAIGGAGLLPAKALGPKPETAECSRRELCNAQLQVQVWVGVDMGGGGGGERY